MRTVSAFSDGVWLIFLFGYFIFYAAIIFVLSLKTTERKVIAVSVIYAVPILMNVFARAVMGWRY
ncbi:MAG TPA: hypothetical protein VMS75_02460 [Terriglobales bacterium]|nr:hypothetical protein [Terriglobales bacterium]